MKFKQAFFPTSEKFYIPKLSPGVLQPSSQSFSVLSNQAKSAALNLWTILKNLIGKIRELTAKLFDFISEGVVEHAPSAKSALRGRLTKMGSYFKYNFPKRKFLKIAGLSVVAIILILIAGTVARKLINPATKSDAREVVAGAKATKDIYKEFSFPLFDDKGKEVASIKYVLESAEKRDEILVKGQKATAIKGRTFLIINIKIVNNYDKSIEINTKDYLRLSVNDSPEFLAPDIHNDPVTVQAISTKFTRLGFPINEEDKSLVLQFGEINGEKQKISLDF